MGWKARGPQAAGGNKLQGADFFFFLEILCREEEEKKSA